MNTIDTIDSNNNNNDNNSNCNNDNSNIDSNHTMDNEKKEDFINSSDSYNIYPNDNDKQNLNNYLHNNQNNFILDEKKINQYNIYVKNIFKFIHTNLLTVASQMPILTFKLFLYSAIVVNNYNSFVQTHEFLTFDNLEAICYEFITQPLIIYEEDINISAQQFDCIVWIVGILCTHINLLDNENYNNIALKLTQHANKLLKKKDRSS